MADKELIQALGDLSSFGLGLAVDRVVNERRDQEVKERAETLLGSYLPTLAAVNNIDATQMAKLNNVGGSTAIVANIDVFSNKMRQEAGAKARMTPDEYNKQLADQVAPYLQVVDSLKGADRTLAYQRLTDGVAGAQSTYLKENQVYKTKEVQSLAMSNIKGILDTASVHSEDLQVGTFDENIKTLMTTWAEKGMSAADSTKLLTNTLAGVISQGDAKLANIILESESMKMVDYNQIQEAIKVGQKVINERIITDNLPGLLSEKDQDELVKRKYVDWLKKGENRGKDDLDFLRENAVFFSKLSGNTTVKHFIGSPSSFAYTGNKEVDVAIKAKREKAQETVSALIAGGFSVDAMVANFTGEDNDLGMVVRNIEKGLGEDSWGILDKISIAKKIESSGIDKSPAEVNNMVDGIATKLAEMQAGDKGVIDWVTDVFSKNLGASAPSIKNAYITKPMIMADLNNYLSKRKGIDFTNDEWMQTFIDNTYVPDQVGDSIMIVKKGTPRYQNGVESKFDTQRVIDDIGFKTISKEITKTYDSTFDNFDFANNDKVAIERGTVYNPVTEKYEQQVKLRFKRWKGTFDGWEDYNLDTMYRFTFDKDSQEVKFEMLPKNEAIQIKNNRQLFNEYSINGWVSSTTDGTIPISIDTYNSYKAFMFNRDDASAKLYKEKHGLTREQAAAAMSAAIF